MMMVKRVLLGVVVIVLLGVAKDTHSTQFRTGSVVSIRDGELLDDVLAFGDDISFEGRIVGDAIAGGRTVTLGDSAVIENSLMAFAQKVDINGLVQNSVRAFAQDVTVRGHAERNLMAFAQRVLLDSRGWVEKDLSVWSAELIMRGRVGGNLGGAADNITISGQIDGDVQVEAGKIVVLSTAIIGGSLKYSSKTEAKIEDGAQVLGGVERLTPKEEDKGYTFGSFLWDAWWYLGLLALGGLFLLMFGGFMNDMSGMIRGGSPGGRSAFPAKTLGVGALFLICLPVASVAAIFTLIGIPAAVLIFIMWIVLLYLADIFVGLAIGQWSLEKARGGRAAPAFMALALGLFLITVVTKIPYAGAFIEIVIAASGIGGFFLAAYDRRAKTGS